jgi:hypothetical protein
VNVGVDQPRDDDTAFEVDLLGQIAREGREPGRHRDDSRAIDKEILTAEVLGSEDLGATKKGQHGGRLPLFLPIWVKPQPRTPFPRCTG